MDKNKKDDYLAVDEALKKIYAELPELRNILNPLFAVVNLCERERGSLPDILKGMVEPAKSCIERYQHLDQRISKILGTLPRKKLSEYEAYIQKENLPK